MITISVLNQKGGAGKTTLATNLAAAAHLAGQRTALIDLDRQGSAFDWFKARRDGSRLDGLAVLRADRELSLPKFRQLGRGADVVVCDGPPRLGDVTRAAAFAADVIVIPMRPGGYDLWACDDTVDLLNSADEMRALEGRRGAPRLFVLNGAPNSSTRAFSHVTEAMAADKRPAASVVIHNRTAFAESVPFGESVLTMFPRSPAALEIAALFARILRTLEQSTDAPVP